MSAPAESGRDAGKIVRRVFGAQARFPIAVLLADEYRHFDAVDVPRLLHQFFGVIRGGAESGEHPGVHHDERDLAAVTQF